MTGVPVLPTAVQVFSYGKAGEGNPDKTGLLFDVATRDFKCYIEQLNYLKGEIEVSDYP